MSSVLNEHTTHTHTCGELRRANVGDTVTPVSYTHQMCIRDSYNTGINLTCQLWLTNGANKSYPFITPAYPSSIP